MRIRDLTGIEDETIVAEQVLALDDPSQTLKITLGQLGDFVSRYLDLKTGAFRPVMTHNEDPTAGALLYSGAWGLGNVPTNMDDAEIMGGALKPTQIFRQTGGSGTMHYGMYGTGLHMAYGDEPGVTLSGNIFIDANGHLTVEWLRAKADGSGAEVHHINKVYSPINKPQPGDIGAVHADWITTAGLNLNNAQKPYFRKADDQTIIPLAREDNIVIRDGITYAGIEGQNESAPYMRSLYTSNLIRLALANAVVTGLRVSGYSNVGGDLRDSGARVMTGIYATNGYDNPTNHESRMLQYAIGGAWYDFPAV